MRAVVGLKLLNQVLYVEVNCSLANAQSVGDLLIAIAVTDESKDSQFPS